MHNEEPRSKLTEIRTNNGNEETNRTEAFMSSVPNTTFSNFVRPYASCDHHSGMTIPNTVNYSTDEPPQINYFNGINNQSLTVYPAPTSVPPTLYYPAGYSSVNSNAPQFSGTAAPLLTPNIGNYSHRTNERYGQEHHFQQECIRVTPRQQPAFNKSRLVPHPQIPFQRRRKCIHAKKANVSNMDKSEESIDMYEEGVNTQGDRTFRGIVPRVEHSVLASFANARDFVDEAKNKVLDWIYPETDFDYYKPMPPCPPCEVLCGCYEPTNIHQIPEISCDNCGGPGGMCGSCSGMVPRCPTCGHPMRQRSSVCGLALPCLPPKIPKPQPLPELVVTNVGPFRDKRYIEESESCGLCPTTRGLGHLLCEAAHDCSYLVGTCLPQCKKEPPPAPVPGRPIQRMSSCFFPPIPPPRVRFPWNLCKKPPPYKPPRGGIVGAIEDIAIMGIGAATIAVEAVADVLDQVAGYPEGSSHSFHCNCPPPLLRYPKNGIYEDPPDAPTKSTGCRAVDAFNNFMDAVIIPPSNPSATQLLPEPEIPPTEETGNPVVDVFNSTLDKLFPPPEPVKRAPRKPRSPATALATYLGETPKPLPRSPDITDCLFPCFIPDSSGKRWVDKNLPPVCFGESTPTWFDANSRQVDYVNFNLMPSEMGQLPSYNPTVSTCPHKEGHDGGSGRSIVTPVAIEGL